jgi:hypothetical protein
MSHGGDTVQVTITCSENGDVNPKGEHTYPVPVNLTVTATPNPGYTTGEWYVDGQPTLTAGSTLEYYHWLGGVPTRTIYVPFVRITNLVHVSAGPQGTLAPCSGCQLLVGWDDSVTFTATPNPHYHVDTWTRDGTVAQRGGNTYVLTGVEAETSVAVSFAADPAASSYTIAASAEPASGGSVTGGGTFAAGSSRTVSATAAVGFVFANWTENGAMVSTSPSYTFTLNNDRTLVAHFVAPPFNPLAGTYNGLFYDRAGAAPRSSGSIAVTVGTKGTLSGSLQLGSTKYSFSSRFGIATNFLQTIKRGRASICTLELQTDPADRDRMIGTVRAAVGTWSAVVEADRAVFSRTANPAPQAGKYTMIWPGSAGTPGKPGGNSYGTITVDTAGKVKLAGSLADGTTISQSGTLSKNGEWPLYVPLYSGWGAVLSWITFATTSSGDLSGDLSWIKPPVGMAKYYPAGFAVETTATGFHYTPPPNGTRVLAFSNGEVVLTGGPLGERVVNYVTVGLNNRVITANKTTLTFTLSSGLFKGTVPTPNGIGAKISYSGVVLQQQNMGKGYFLGTSQSGEAIFEPQ